MRVYFAGPLFTPYERSFIDECTARLRAAGIEVFVPHEEVVAAGGTTAAEIFAIDYEGVAKQRVTLVESGVCRDVVHDSMTASREGARSTGHGSVAPNPYGPYPTNQLMAAGSASREELIAGLDRGLLVTRFHYTNPVHPKRAVITGMTRDGRVLLERGEIVGPVRNLRFTQSYLDAMNQVDLIGRESLLMPLITGACRVPALKIRGWNFTGATEL